MKRKIVTINCTGYDGSTGQIIKDIDIYTGDEFEYAHYYQIPESDVPNGHLLTSWNVTRCYYYLSRITGNRYGLGSNPTRKLIAGIRDESPDLVHIHCPNFHTINLYRLLSFLKAESIPTVVTNHAEFFYTGGCAYTYDCEKYKSGCKSCERQFDEVHKYLVRRTAREWQRMKEAFSDAENITLVAVSDWAADKIKRAPITEGLPVVTIKNGVNTEIFCSSAGTAESERRISFSGRGKNIEQYVGEESLKDTKPGLACKPQANYRHKILHVTSHFSDREGDIKGGRYLLDLAKMRPNYDFIVAGEYEEIDSLPENVTLLGKVSDKAELARLYREADTTVLTSQKETFGMAYAESVCCGTKVVAFYAGGTESIALPDTAIFVDYGDVEQLAQALDEAMAEQILYEPILSQMPCEEQTQQELGKNVKNRVQASTLKLNVSENACKHFSAERMAHEYAELYRKMLVKSERFS